MPSFIKIVKKLRDLLDLKQMNRRTDVWRDVWTDRQRDRQSKFDCPVNVYLKQLIYRLADIFHCKSLARRRIPSRKGIIKFL